MNEIGGDRVGRKLGKKDSNSEALLTYLASQLTKLGVLYLHAFEPKDEPCLQFIRRSFKGTLIASGGYNKNEGDVAISETVLVKFHWIYYSRFVVGVIHVSFQISFITNFSIPVIVTEIYCPFISL